MTAQQEGGKERRARNYLRFAAKAQSRSENINVFRSCFVLNNGSNWLKSFLINRISWLKGPALDQYTKILSPLGSRDKKIIVEAPYLFVEKGVKKLLHVYARSKE